MHHENDILKLRLRATINRVRFVFWRIKMSAGTIIHSLLTDVVVLTPSDEILPSAYPSCILNSATSTNQNLPSKFWKVTSVDLGAE